jgi:N-acetylglucosaminyl-diphospho-decaprenol L-rhamnosyltransferase
MPGARIDVGIVTWNTRDLTLAAVERALAAASPDLEVRVLLRDNGSIDGTVEAVRAAHPDVLVDSGENIGFAAGVNTLLGHSDAPWFFLLNSDAWPQADALAELVAVAGRHPLAGVVAPRLVRPDGTVEPSTHALPSLRTALAGVLGGPPAPPSVEGPVGWAVGAALLLRREAVDDIGPWDERYFMYAEDLDYCWRARQRGWQVCFAPQAVVTHVGNASGAQRFGEQREQVAIGNANRVVQDRLGPVRAAGWRGLNAAAAVRMAVVAECRGERDRAAFWWRQLPAHLGRR